MITAIEMGRTRRRRVQCRSPEFMGGPDKPGHNERSIFVLDGTGLTVRVMQPARLEFARPTMTIENLIKVVPPPAEPSGNYSGPWDAIEAQLGTRLPDDYKDFVRVYGHGDLMGFIGIHVPASWSPYMRLVQEAWATAEAFRNAEDLPFPMWPSPGGLLPFGKTDLGDTLFWLTRGPTRGLAGRGHGSRSAGNLRL